MAETTPYRFVLLAHSQDLVESVRALADMNGYTLEWRLVDFDTAVPMARECLEAGADVIICHGGTGNGIVRALGGNVVIIDRTDMDVIKTIREAARVSREIIFAAHRNEHHDIALMEELLDVRIHHVSYEDSRLLFATLTQLYARGVRVLVGGGVTKQGMDDLGGKGFVIAANPHNIKEALDRACALAGQMQRERAQHENLLAIFRRLEEGVVCVRSDGLPVFVNSKAAKLLDIKAPYTDETARRMFATLHLFETLRDKEERKDALVEINGEQLVVTTLPVTARPGLSAAVALFRDVPSLQKINRKIGEELYSKGFVTRYALADIKGVSPAVSDLKNKILRFAKVDASVLVYGETGTGKELVAHTLHANSKRAEKAFVAVNFAALPANLLESELFGYEDGAFTGARRGGKAGLFELAHKGTLFLDEVGEISHEMQLRLLRVIEAKEVMRIGGNRYLPVDVRVVGASHKFLPDLAAENRFRFDLYHRLATLKLHVPPLRDRLEDIPALLQNLLNRYGRTERVLNGEIYREIMRHKWPGNIRELLSAMESYLVLLNTDVPDPELFAAIMRENSVTRPAPGAASAVFSPGASLQENLHLARSRIIEAAIRHHNGDKKAASDALGISYSTLWRNQKMFGPFDVEVIS
ncbi:MAG: sigma 54-interacting transcriptional regulator [Desulfovibrio sp.]|jgi:propionate catabolism operon transcriptional regulator|nr:sigma 54-interacting transcriptional regulator [Desulfovibrio sp.]